MSKQMIIKKLSSDIQTKKISIPELAAALGITGTHKTASELFDAIVSAYMQARGL